MAGHRLPTPRESAWHDTALRGRRGERAVLDRLADAVRGARAGCQVVRAAGVQSVMELAFAGLHQLCAPMLDRCRTGSWSAWRC